MFIYSFLIKYWERFVVIGSTSTGIFLGRQTWGGVTAMQGRCYFAQTTIFKENFRIAKIFKFHENFAIFDKKFQIFQKIFRKFTEFFEKI